MRRIFINPWRDNTRTRSFRQNIRSEIPYRVDFSKAVADRTGSLTISSVSWTSTGTRETTIADKTLTSDVAEATLMSEWGGFGIVRVEATYSDGNTESVYIKVRFEDLETRRSA